MEEAEQLGGATGLEALGQHEDAEPPPKLGSDLARGGESFYRTGVGGGIGTSSDDGHVLGRRVRTASSSARSAYLGNDVEPLESEEFGGRRARSKRASSSASTTCIGGPSSSFVSPPGGLTT